MPCLGGLRANGRDVAGGSCRVANEPAQTVTPTPSQGPEVWMDLQSKWDLWHARKVRKSA